MHWILVANGEMPRSARIAACFDTANQVVGVDGGCRILDALQVLPDLVIGDMDSIPQVLLNKYKQQNIKIIIHPSAKDETDLELALDMALATKPSLVTILGAIGDRLDHTLANILLLSRCLDQGVLARILDDQQSIYLMDDQLELYGQPGDLFSLVPIKGTITGVTLHGLEYPLQETTLSFGSPRGLSNVFTSSQALVKIQSGLALVFHLHSS